MTELDSFSAVLWQNFGVAINVRDGSSNTNKLEEGASGELKLVGTVGKEVAGSIEFE